MDVKTDFREVKGRSGKLAEAAPETMKAFGALRDSCLLYTSDAADEL